jgi:carotenoid cleavage dioxygenase-like enzyme
MSGFKVLRSLTASTDLPVKTAIKGKLPSWLNGTLYRNGPGRFEFNGKRYT